MPPTIARPQWIWIALFVAIAALIHLNGPGAPKVASVDALAAFPDVRDKRAIVIDVREREPYAREHLPGAISMPIGEIDARLGELASRKADRIVVYCNEGSTRGPVATDKLNRAGFAGAVNLEGGIEGWRAAKLPVER
jgi:rhodanese-related sulfurtransferase